MLKCLNINITKGFTLVEVIVAIFLLTVGIIGVSALITSTISSATHSSQKLVAAYLAQEGIEIVRNIRDTNWIEQVTNPAIPWDEGIPEGSWEADYTSETLDNSYTGKFLNIGSNGFYHYSGGSSALPEKIALEEKSNTKSVPRTETKFLVQGQISKTQFSNEPDSAGNFYDRGNYQYFGSKIYQGSKENVLKVFSSLGEHSKQLAIYFKKISNNIFALLEGRLKAFLMGFAQEKIEAQNDSPKIIKASIEPAKKDWRADEEPEFEIIPINQNLLEKIIAKISPQEEPKIKVTLIPPASGEISLQEGEDFSAETHSPTKITIFRPKDFRPGLYKLIITLEKNGKVFNFEQDFSWGVLAINVNKSIYLPNETAYLQIAALSVDGRTICDANLKLEVISPSGEPFSVSVQKSGECGANNVINVPDYFAYYQVGEPGIYEMKLTNLDNSYEIEDSFEVRDYVPFDIERTGPTRIYPPASYEMKFKIKADQDFEGQIIEQVPATFEVATLSTANIDANNREEVSGTSRPDSRFFVVTEGKTKQITWQASWRAGEEYELRYQFDAPDISPYLYLLGPLTFTENKFTEDSPLLARGNGISNILNSIFLEARQWQIAADAPSYTQACTKAGSCSCYGSTHGCGTNTQCLDGNTCSYSCPAAGANSSQNPSPPCVPGNSNTCACDPVNGVCYNGKTCSCTISGNCTYTCTGGFQDCDGSPGCECSTSAPANCCSVTTRYYNCSGSCYGSSCPSCPNASYCSTENCATKSSTESDGGDVPYTGGYVTDYDTCSPSACNSTPRRDACSGTNSNGLTEYIKSGSSFTTHTYDSNTSSYCYNTTNDYLIDCAANTANCNQDPVDVCECNLSTHHCVGTSCLPNTTFPTVTISAATGVTSSQATLNGNITTTGGENPTVTMYWGDNDGGTDATCPGGSWDYCEPPTSPAQPQGAVVFWKDVAGLSPGTPYYFSAKATNSAGTDWPDTGSLSFTTKPNPPTGLSAVAVSQTQIDLTWTDGAGAENTKIMRREGGSCPSDPSDGTQVYFDLYPGSPVSDNTVTCGNDYCYRAWSHKTGAPGSGYSDGYSEDNTSTLPCVTCPDGFCNVAGGECDTCDADCDVADCCTDINPAGDLACNPAVGENSTNCPADCPVPTYTLTVNKAGTGTGTVNSTIPDGRINCGPTCSASFDSGTSVTLKTTANSDSSFASWGGDCSSCGVSSQCSFTMNGNKPNCVATFSIITCPDGFCNVAGGECDTCGLDCDLADCCGIDPECNTTAGEDWTHCPSDCQPVVATKFKRKITILDRIDLDGDGSIDQMTVRVEVSWEEKGRTYTVTAQEYLYNWY
jgi:type II secretory pathway pseudopilin PulG